MSGRFVDLSHALGNEMPAYPGLPAPRFGAILDHDASRARYEGRAEFYLGEVAMAGNTGTYIDSPWHRFRDGRDLAHLPLESLVGLAGVVLDAAPEPGPVELDAVELDVRGKAVLVRTGWDARWGSERYWEPGPFLGPRTLDALVAGGAGLVGVDFANVDDVADLARPAHTRLLGAGVLVVEHLCNLGALPSTGFRFFAPVLAVQGGASFPVRAFAELDA